jgi:hypothetical protein
MSVLNLRHESPRVEFVDVSPEIARQWLDECNLGNRRISQRAVHKYALDMKSGRWRHRTGEPIIFDRNGRLQQGQHRLAAVVSSGAHITFMVLFNADPQDFQVLDQGLRRSSGQVLQMAGVHDANLIASIARNYLLLQKYPDRQWSSVTDLTPQEIIQFAQSNLSDLEVAAVDGRLARKQALIPESQYAAVAYYVRRLSPACGAWGNFHRAVTTGEMLQSGNPAFALRRWAVNRKGGHQRRSSGHLSSQVTVASVAKAWNGFVNGRSMSIVKWPRTELPMPVPVPSPY